MDLDYDCSDPENECDYSMVGCVVSPGFDVQDFELSSFDYISKTLVDPSEMDRKIVQYLCHE